MSGSSGGGSSNTKTTTEPWEFQRPFLAGGSEADWGREIPGVFPEAEKLYKNGQLSPEYYQGNTVAGQSPYTSSAIHEQANQAYRNLYGFNPLLNTLNNSSNSIFSGDTLWNDADKSGFNTLARMSGNQTGTGITGNTGLDALNGLASSVGNTGIAGNTGLDIATQLALSKGNAGISGNSGLDKLKELMAERDKAGIEGNTGLDNLNDYATNKDSNPWLDKMYERANSQQQAALNAQFSGSGRYGSGAHTASAADASGNLATDMYGKAYENDANRRLDATKTSANLYGTLQNASADRQSQNANNYANLWGTFDQNNANRQLQAALGSGSLFNSASQSNADRQLNAAQSAGTLFGNLSTANADRQLNAAKGQGDMWSNYVNTITGNLGAGQDLANQGYRDSAMLGEAGGALDDYNQSLINADIDRWNYNQNRPLDALSKYNQLIQGNYGGTTTSTGKQNTGSGNRVGGMLGGAMSGAALGSYFGPWGTAVGGGLGGLAGLF